MAAATQSKEQLIDRVRAALKPHLESYLNQKTKGQLEQEAEIERIQKVISKEPTNSPTLPALQAVIDSIKQELSKPGINAPLRRDAALAVLTVCNEHRLPLQFKQDPAAPSAAAQPTKSKGGRKRLPKEEMLAACDAIMKVLPPSDTPDELCMSKSRVAEKCGLDAKTTSSALIKLNRDGQATSNGIRGAGGGWRRL